MAGNPPLREIQGNPDTFPWYTGWGAGPVFRRMDGTAVGPVLIESRDLGAGGYMERWEIVVVRPPEHERNARMQAYLQLAQDPRAQAAVDKYLKDHTIQM